jgi:hypothetical protein
MLATVVPLLRRDGDLVLTGDEATLVGRHKCSHDRSPAGRRAGSARATRAFAHQVRHLAQVPDPDPHLSAVERERTWVRRDRPVGHVGGSASGQFCFTLTVLISRLGGPSTDRSRTRRPSMRPRS